jgi:hypothetical protein
MDLRPLTYSMLINNIDQGNIKKKKSEYNYINLNDLVKNFPLDMEYNQPDWNPYGTLPGFVSKSYYQSLPETGYNLPPKGPIDPFFVCTYCKKSGPEFHSVECKRPFDSSLVLTQEGTNKYPGRVRGTSHILIVKKPGQKKVITSSLKNERFTDNVELIYENKDFSKTVIRISRNGVINIISANYQNDTLPNEIVKKINQSGSLTKDYPGQRYVIDESISYKYLISAQFQLFQDKSENYVDLDQLNSKLWESKRFKRVLDSETVFMLDNTDNNYIIKKYVYNSGEIESRSNKATNPYILFTMIDENVKINVMIYRKGAVQLKGSYINKPDGSLDLNVIKRAYIFIREILERVIHDNKIIVHEIKENKKISVNNTIDSKEPQACHNRAGYELRPNPFSFYGKCAMPGYYVAPRGVQRPDGKFEPCCFKLKKSGKDSEERYKNILLNGYPDTDASKYFENIPDPDNLTAIYKPGTKIPETRRFRGLNDFSKDELINCIERSGYIKSKNVFNDYTSLKETVLAQYMILTGMKTFSGQHPVALTRSNFNLFTKQSYIVTPIFEGVIHVLLFFNQSGVSYFINNLNEVSESGLLEIPELASTILDGYLYPFKDTEFNFYPTDILYFKNVNIMSKVYSDKSNDDRFSGLLYTVSIIKKKTGILNIQLTFDEDIVNGSKYYLKEYPISGLLFIPSNGEYQRSKINKNLLMFNNLSQNLLISLSLTKIDKNLWKPQIESKDIPEKLLPQIDGAIEISIKFTDDNRIKNGDIVLFKILLNRITGKINIGKPLQPLEKIDFQINDYPDVIGILQSIQDPIKKETFTDSNGFMLDSKVYNYQTDDVTKPLTIT